MGNTVANCCSKRSAQEAAVKAGYVAPGEQNSVEEQRSALIQTKVEEGKAMAEAEGEHSSFLVWVITLGAETWLAAVSWVAIIAYFQTFYWHVLNPHNLGIDYQSIILYASFMVGGPLLLEVPCLVQLLTHKLCSIVLALVVVAGVLYGNETTDERQRSTAYLVAMFAVGVRCVAIGGQKAPTNGRLATERALGPYAVTLGLLAVLVARLAYTWLHPMRETTEGKAIFGIISFVSLALLCMCSPGASEGLIEGETCCGCCVASLGSLFSGTTMASLLMFSLWLLDAPWAVPHYVGMYGHHWEGVVVACYAVGIIQSFMLPLWPCSTCILIGEVVGGGLLICLPSLDGASAANQAFAGGCLLALAMPTAWMFGQQQASQSVQGRAAGLTYTLAGAVTFVLLLIYMGTLTNSTPILSAIFFGKFEFFTMVLTACLLVGLLPTFLSSLTLHMEISHEARCTTGLWLILLMIGGGVLCGLAYTAPKTAPQFPNRGLVVGSFNVQQGYRTDGEPNFQCVSDVLRTEMPHVTGLQESDSVHVVSGNVNVLGYVADTLGLYRTVGPAGYRGSVGVSLLSEYPLEVVDEANPSGAHQLPAVEGGTLNRFLTHSKIEVNSTQINVISVHTAWFGDPAIQIKFIAEYIANITGPLVLVGDFNLDVSGQNSASLLKNSTEDSFAALHAVPGLKSLTQFSNPQTCTYVTNDDIKYCPGLRTTVDMGKPASSSTLIESLGGNITSMIGYSAVNASKTSSTPGYQLDYIFYRGLVAVGGMAVSAKSQELHCSDHLFVKGTFVLPPASTATVAPVVPVTVAPVVTAAPVTAAPVAAAPVTAAPVTAAPVTEAITTTAVV